MMVLLFRLVDRCRGEAKAEYFFITMNVSV